MQGKEISLDICISEISSTFLDLCWIWLFVANRGFFESGSLCLWLCLSLWERTLLLRIQSNIQRMDCGRCLLRMQSRFDWNPILAPQYPIYQARPVVLWAAAIPSFCSFCDSQLFYVNSRNHPRPHPRPSPRPFYPMLLAFLRLSFSPQPRSQAGH